MADNDIMLIQRLANLLEAALTILDQAAASERQAEEGKQIQSITTRRRAEAARALVAAAYLRIGGDQG
jgi:hypothetical protein